LAELEAEDRRNRRVQRLLIEARIPRDKTLSVLDCDRFPPAVRSQIRALGEGQFLSSSTNVRVFGNPGTGKTHLVCAVGHELIRQGHSVFLTDVSELVERLLVAKKDLRGGSIASNASSSMTSAMCNKGAKKWRCCLRCFRSDTSGAVS
jgi:DNA replication protein DnaC